MVEKNDFKILLVEDDDNLRGELKAVLEKKYLVSQATNGKLARELLTLENYNLVISDIQMPYLTGIELLEWIKINKAQTKVFLCTGFAQILETKSAAEFGADDFLTKPFSSTELFEKIDKLLNLNASKQPENAKPIDLDDEFCKVAIEDFISEKDTQYGIFVRITNTRYIKVAHQGGKLAEERIKNFKDKGVHYLYVKKSDFDKLVGFTLFVNKALNQSEKISPEKKIRFLKYTGELVMEHIYVAGIDQKAILEARSFIETSIDAISADPNIFNMINTLNTHVDYLYVHSLAVSSFSYLIAKEMGYNNPSVLFKLALGGLLHDVGKKELPKELLKKSRHQYSTDDLVLYESHVIRGKEILESMNSIPSEVITIAYEHHENSLAQGFPRRLDGRKINPLSQIVIVANLFAGYAIRKEDSTSALTPNESLQKLEFHKKDFINENVLAALKNIFKKTNRI